MALARVAGAQATLERFDRARPAHGPQDVERMQPPGVVGVAEEGDQDGLGGCTELLQRLLGVVLQDRVAKQRRQAREVLRISQPPERPDRRFTHRVVLPGQELPKRGAVARREQPAYERRHGLVVIAARHVRPL